MIRIKYKYLFIAFVLIAMGTSCKKSFLVRNPPTSLTPDQALATEADLQNALRGAYSGLRAVDLFGRTVPLLGDLMADNCYVSSLNSGRYTFYNTYTWTVADANVLGFWTSAYVDILRCNNIINSTVTGATVAQTKGEAYAVRALNYYYLVRYFAKPFTDDPNAMGVPIVLTYNPDVYPPRSKVTEVYTQIINDLNQAYTLATGFTNSSQFSKYSAKGLLAKVYLSMGDKTNAKAAAVDVITNSGFTVVNAAGYAAYWNNGAIRTDKLETLFEVSSDAISNLQFDALPNIYSQSGYGDMICPDTLYNLYIAADVRKGLLAPGQRPALTPAIFVNKYPNTSGDRSDTKLVRMSEMYLIAAEASLPADEATALADVNYITSRRNATAIASTGAQLFEDVITERRKELAFEGERYLDFQRLKRDINRPPNFPASAQAIPYSNFRRLLPIPQLELDANAAIRVQQNPGY